MAESISASQALCPKCGAQVAASAIACTKCGNQLAVAAPDTVILTLGQKIAAAAFIINGLCLLAEVFLSKDKEAARGARSAIVSVILGGYLFTGKASALKWAKIAAVLGGVIFGVVNYVQGGLFMAVIQLLFSLSLVGLLFGEAGKFRVGLCSLLLLGYFGMEGLGLYQEISGTAAAPASAPAQP